jgi:enterochelin esterase-like enzyme
LNIDRVRFRSAELDEPRFFVALVPAGTATVSDVLFLNHGWADRPEELLRALKIDQVYTSLLLAQQVKPAIVVLPDVRFSNYFRRHSDQFPFNQSLTLVAEEAAGWVTRVYSVQAKQTRWGIAGFSFGGYVALDVARRYSGRFSSASVVSAFYDEDWTFWPSQPGAPGRLDSRGRGKQTVVAPGPVPRLLLACGTDDRFFKTMVKLHERLQSEGIRHEWMTAEGGHTWSYWSSVLTPMLLFHLGPREGGQEIRDSPRLRDSVSETESGQPWV